MRLKFTPFLCSLLAVSAYAEEDFLEDKELPAYIELAEENDAMMMDNEAVEWEELAQAYPKDEQTPPASSAEPTMYRSARSEIDHRFGLFLSGEFLYWKVGESGLNYSLVSKNVSGSSTEQAYSGVRGNPDEIQPHYHAGYRLDLDIQLPKDGWDLQAVWTRYQNHAHQSSSANANETLWAYYFNNNGNILFFTEADAKWHLNYNTFDTTISRSFYLAKYLSVRPLMGFRGAWIEQKLNINYNRISNPAGVYTSHNHNNFVGYGMIVGLQSIWPLKFGFSLTGNITSSLLWSRFKVDQFETSPGSVPRTHLKDRLYLTTPTVEMMGGVKWSSRFFKDKLYFDIHVGWEEQIWFDQNQLNFFENNTIFGAAIGKTKNQQHDLTFYGWTIGAQLGF